LKQQAELRFEPEQRQAGFDELRFQMMKLSLMHDSLTKDCKEYLAKFLPGGHSSFHSLLLKTAEGIKQ